MVAPSRTRRGSSLCAGDGDCRACMAPSFPPAPLNASGVQPTTTTAPQKCTPALNRYSVVMLPCLRRPAHRSRRTCFLGWSRSSRPPCVSLWAGGGSLYFINCATAAAECTPKYTAGILLPVVLLILSHGIVVTVRIVLLLLDHTCSAGSIMIPTS